MDLGWMEDRQGGAEGGAVLLLDAVAVPVSPNSAVKRRN